MKSAAEIRTQLEDCLHLDLVGPDNDHPFAKELIPESPTRWYLCGFLMPKGTPAEQRSTPDADDEIDSAPLHQGAADDNAPTDRGASGKSLFPASLGLSVLLPAATQELEVQVDWGDYQSKLSLRIDKTKHPHSEANAQPSQHPQALESLRDLDI